MSATLVELDDQECMRLLRSRAVGRLAFAHEGWPVVLPVNFVFDEPTIVIRTADGAKLEHAPMTAVAFEVDDFDPSGAWGWSVLAQGPAFDITTSSDQRSRHLRQLAVAQWPAGQRDHWLTITALTLSGRRFGTPPA
ncbi:MAG TPA: pyridoxamine 5'-phosphate oxidase family protein [Acidimicrobiales bacterium]|nr:pyridoxamine 5'-phosphate oxidase family protein [Acidimicrobiales bacterium]